MENLQDLVRVIRNYNMPTLQFFPNIGWQLSCHLYSIHPANHRLYQGGHTQYCSLFCSQFATQLCFLSKILTILFITTAPIALITRQNRKTLDYLQVPHSLPCGAHLHNCHIRTAETIQLATRLRKFYIIPILYQLAKLTSS